MTGEAPRPARSSSLITFPSDVLRNNTADLIIRLDRRTLEYLHYRELTPGTLALAPSEFMNRRMRDVLPECAELLESAIQTASQNGTIETVTFCIRGRYRRSRILITGEQIISHVSSIEAT